ncbi:MULTISPECIES: glutathione transferase GstA [Tenebrionibacter/Tenebrionicola group]|jgi:glutathione S-transferase|uniref:Glutathione transferase GstA n=2 Tax=Tenebrionibacter/Tenebrionicola group TaxID=2969848 RepID=A0A8K0V3G4_9ENTR|nr:MULTISPECIES: glutathione transferase GstA [Tenebrionibacter/Tenebrionicola group]MBK4716784.1 glutathione transferase GstA [Tenebrionibacter intestinalis]MBV5096824.1 glutathione transferase GstA [Tenebrionicola larvae]
MKLYYSPGACSLSPHIILRESGLDFSLVKVDLAAKRTEHGDNFLDINPKGQVPTLQLDDSTLLTEGVAIVQYIADSVPDRQLLAPAGSLTRYHTLEWMNYIATELHKGFTPLFRANTPEEYKTLSRETLEQKIRYVDEKLSDNPWLMGTRFTIADAYLFTVLRWAQALKLDINGLKNIKRFMAQMQERPAVKAATAAEGL